MLVKLEKVFNSGSKKSLVCIDLKYMDEYLIYNFHDRLDLDIYFENISLDYEKEGHLVLTNKENDEEIKDMYFRKDFEEFKIRKDTGMFDNMEFINILFDKCSDVLKDKEKLPDNRKIVFVYDLLNNDYFVMHNFRNIYSSIEEYLSIEKEKSLVKRID